MTSSATRHWPTRRTRSVRRSRVPRAWRPTRSPRSGRAPLGCCGSTARPTRADASCRSTHLRKVVEWCRERGTILVSDECYIECAWSDDPADKPLSILDPRVSDGSHDGILAVHSLSKRSNLAGYRCAFVAGDPALVGELLAVRKNLGLQMPGPQQRAMIAALDDDTHVARAARDVRRAPHVAEARPRVGRLPDRPLGGLALPLGDPRPGLLGHGRRAGRPGHPRGSRGLLRRRRRQHVRVAFTATDERVAAAVARLAG